MEEKGLLHTLEEAKDKPLWTKGVVLFFLFAVVLGIGAGYFFGKTNFGSKVGNSTLSSGRETFSAGQVFGSKDEKTFRDQAEGLLKPGGVDGEGEYHLERPGGPSQNVYLTSSVLDLSKFVDYQVRVWGETNKARKAGWLMDVGRLQVLGR